MKYVVCYILNDGTVHDWTIHNSLEVALKWTYYWLLYDSYLNSCKIYKVGTDLHLEISEIYKGGESK